MRCVSQTCRTQKTRAQSDTAKSRTCDGNVRFVRQLHGSGKRGQMPQRSAPQRPGCSIAHVSIGPSIAKSYQDRLDQHRAQVSTDTQKDRQCQYSSGCG
eukprot:3122454-Rhodomonas_salina.1